MQHYEFDEPTRCVVAVYERHDREDSVSYEFLTKYTRVLNNHNWSGKLKSVLDKLDTTKDLVAVAYVRCDESLPFEGNSYAILAYEQEPGRTPTTWVLDEIAEEISYW